MKLVIYLRRGRDDVFQSWLDRSGRTRIQLVDEIFSVYEWAVEMVSSGRVVASINPKTGGYQGILCPALEAMKKK